MEVNERAFVEAVKAGDFAQVQALIDQDPALVYAQDEQGLSAVMLSAYSGHNEITSLLLENGTTLNLFEAAALGKMTRVIQILNQTPEVVNSYAVDGFTALGLAAFFGHQTVAQSLLSRRADVNLPSTNELHAYPINSAVASRRLELVDLLLSAGAEINACEGAGYTPLHQAAADGHLVMVRLLIEHGADPAARTVEGKTALDLAVEKGEQSVINLLEAIQSS